MTTYAREAVRQIKRLIQHYETLERDAALRNLRAALLAAETRIDLRPLTGSPAPRPYPALAKAGRLWIKERSYWIAYDPQTAIILGVFHETGDIPGNA